ncbi:DUF2066 domain-containing protein [Marinobacterium arenosum]|uniref:DUF2066 domain-containing protein n=1 Tax=Marinobacterium arenosum TaxID=2862496 RepID=UPI001C94D0F2|nr:DUF2066 domain-containing protein [Marinobacterium arenosum]MBY4677905.1 DUF2066 domain-containing protein [Marinobacterium arenosum]
MNKRFWPLFLLMMLVTTLCRGGEVAGLYNASLLVPNQTSRPTAAQLSEALAEVLVRVSGRRDLLGKPAVRQALLQAAPLVRSFSYRSTNQAVRDASGTEQPAQLLALEFDRSLVDQLLGKAGERPLGNQRPTLMVWLAAEQQGRRDFLSSDHRLITPLRQAARERGLPVQLPLLDLTDQQALPLSDLWGLFADGVEQASLRYRPDAVLAGRLMPMPGGSWAIEWLLLDRGEPMRFVTEGSEQQALRQAVDRVADRLFSALTGDSAGYSYYLDGIQLDISNVRSLRDYSALLDYLGQLSLVTGVYTEQVDGSRLLLRVQLEGHIDQLQQALSLEPRLVPSHRGASAGDNTMALHYRWQG